MPILDIETIARVGVRFMDEDHAREVELLNAVAAQVGKLRAGAGSRQAVSEGWTALLAHTRAHFAREEAAMAQAGFPTLRLHQAEHRLVLDAMEGVGKAFEVEGDAQGLWEYVSQTVPDWLTLHVSGVDLKAAEFLLAAEGRR